MEAHIDIDRNTHDTVTQTVGFGWASLRRWHWVDVEHNGWTLMVLWK